MKQAIPRGANTEETKLVKRKRMKLVAIKQIPGLFLKKKVNRRKRGGRMTPDVMLLEVKKEEIGTNQISPKQNSENPENKQMKAKPKVLDCIWTKEYLDNERSHRNKEKNSFQRYLFIVLSCFR